MANNLITKEDREQFELLSSQNVNKDKGRQSVNEYIFSMVSENSRQTVFYNLKRGLSVINEDFFTFDWKLLTERLVLAIRERLAQKYAPSTVNAVLTSFKGVAKRLKINKVISADENDLIFYIKSVRGSRINKGRALSQQEVGALFNEIGKYASAKALRDSALLSVMVECGLRRSEAAGLQYENVHLTSEAPSLTIIGKGNKERKCFIPPHTVERLKEWFASRGSFSGPCFCRVDRHDNIYHEALTNHRVWTICREWAKEVDMKKWTTHDMRRTYATNLFNMGADIKIVKDMMGHSNIATTAIYDKRGEDVMMSFAKKMNAG